MGNVKAGCAKSVDLPVEQVQAGQGADAPPSPEKGAGHMIKVGQKAPDFEAGAYFNGDFTSVKLSDYLGKWVVLCFYPGDFTFV